MVQATNKAGRLVWLIRHVVFPAIFALVLVAVVGGVFVYRDSMMRNFLSATQPSDEGTQVPEQVVASEPEPITQISPRAVQVNSYPPGREYALSQWQVVDDPGGFVDAVFVNGELIGMDEIIMVSTGDVIHLTGWAGHRLLGMRFPEVLFSVCGSVIGGVAVTGERADIADSVHPNLMYSGWEANLFASDLPHCDEAAIAVWGRPPVGWTLRPVLGEWRFEVQTVADAPAMTVIHEEPLIRPEDASKADTLRLSIHHDKTALHQCANTTCDVLSYLPQGLLNAVIVEEFDGWVLLQSVKGSGWTVASAFRILP
jgi:hypothetical protein